MGRRNRRRVSSGGFYQCVCTQGGSLGRRAHNPLNSSVASCLFGHRKRAFLTSQRKANFRKALEDYRLPKKLLFLLTNDKCVHAHDDGRKAQLKFQKG